MLAGAPPFSATDLDPAVPGVMGDLVFKLLAEVPEARYQSARALAADLLEARQRLRGLGQVTRFPLGRQDLAPERPLGDQQDSPLFAQLTGQIEERKRAEAALRLLAEAGSTLAESLDFEATLNKVTRLAIPLLAEWCVVDVVEGTKLRRVAEAHVDPEKERLVRAIRAQHQDWAPPPSSLQVLRSGTPLVIAEITPEVVARYVTNPVQRALVEEVGLRTGMVLPLKARERTLGVISFISSSQHYGAKELALGEELARRAALAIDNARLYGEAREAIRLRDEFLSVASHELNTPMTALRLLQGLHVSQLADPAPWPSWPLAHAPGAAADRPGARPAGRHPHRQRRAGHSARARRPGPSWSGRRWAVSARARAGPLPGRAPGAGTGAGQLGSRRIEQVLTNLLANAAKFGASAATR